MAVIIAMPSAAMTGRSASAGASAAAGCHSSGALVTPAESVRRLAAACARQRLRHAISAETGAAGRGAAGRGEAGAGWEARVRRQVAQPLGRRCRPEDLDRLGQAPGDPVRVSAGDLGGVVVQPDPEPVGWQRHAGRDRQVDALGAAAEAHGNGAGLDVVRPPRASSSGTPARSDSSGVPGLDGAALLRQLSGGLGPQLCSPVRSRTCPSQSPSRASSGTGIRSTEVFTNMPTRSAAPGSSGGRPETTIPKVTSALQPTREHSAHAALTMVLGSTLKLAAAWLGPRPGEAGG